tara:strand:- start:119 stop:322 length:204 start_codon:yes stop_codon:yes gene_type:complete
MKTKKRWIKSKDAQVPKKPCFWCGKPVHQDDWVINALGQLLHIDECFRANWKSHDVTRRDSRDRRTA